MKWPLAGALVCASVVSLAHAQVVEVIATHAVTIAAGTAVQLEVDQALDSDEVHAGDTFPIVLHAPLEVDGVVLVPAGTRGTGVVISAAPRQRDQQPGELAISARRLEYNGTQVLLRSTTLVTPLIDTDRTTRAMQWLIDHGAAEGHPSNRGLPKGALVQAKLVRDLVGTPIQAAAQ